MKKLLSLVLSLLLINSAVADQLDGLAIFDFLIYVILTGAVSLVVLLLSSIIRFSRKECKVSIVLNFSATVLLICSIFSIDNLGSGIDPGFLTFCIGTSLLSILLVILNYRIGFKKSKKINEYK